MRSPPLMPSAGALGVRQAQIVPQTVCVRAHSPGSGFARCSPLTSLRGPPTARALPTDRHSGERAPKHWKGSACRGCAQRSQGGAGCQRRPAEDMSGAQRRHALTPRGQPGGATGPRAMTSRSLTWQTNVPHRQSPRGENQRATPHLNTASPLHPASRPWPRPRWPGCGRLARGARWPCRACSPCRRAPADSLG